MFAIVAREWPHQNVVVVMIGSFRDQGHSGYKYCTYFPLQDLDDVEHETRNDLFGKRVSASKTLTWLWETVLHSATPCGTIIGVLEKDRFRPEHPENSLRGVRGPFPNWEASASSADNLPPVISSGKRSVFSVLVFPTVSLSTLDQRLRDKLGENAG